MAPYRCRPNVMLAAPVVTLPTAIARHLCAELLGWGDPAWHRLAHLVTGQLFPGGSRHTLTLPPRDLQDLLAVLLSISIDFSSGTLSPEGVGFTEADIQETIDLHHHHYGSLLDC
ncbi:hypothetical protein AB0J01_38015 [Streptomyces sp. NPDC050204]|uniref:hypothetical protein n=1 Tax=Streptomyces sp. NPDC050204 TaxID=3155514 RepID=UPI003414E821